MVKAQDPHYSVQQRLSWERREDRYTLSGEGREIGFLEHSGPAARARYGEREYLMGGMDPATDYGVLVIRESAIGPIIAQAEPADRAQGHSGRITFTSGVMFTFEQRQYGVSRVTLSDAEGRPALEVREENPARGTIEIRNIPSLQVPEYPMLLLFGLFLLHGAADAVASPGAGQTP